MSENMNISIKVKLLKEDLYIKLLEIEKMDSYLFKKICLFAIAEQYAQDCDNYPNNNSKAFETFLEKYSNEVILKYYDPVTLYYRYKEKLDEKELDLSFISFCKTEKAIDVCQYVYGKDIVEEVRGIAKNKLEKHTYNSLIYKYRCKLSHELNNLSSNWDDEQNKNEPIYSFVCEDLETGKGRWELRFPYKFLKNLFVESINGYLDDCVKTDRRPFEKYKQYLHWYE